VDAVADEDPAVRLAVAQALHGPLTLADSDTRAADALARALSDTDAEVRAAAADSLDAPNATARRALPALVLALGDSNLEVAKAALGALGSIGDATVFDAVAALLNAPDPGVQSAAVQALGALGDKRAVDPLLKALGGDDEGVRAAAALALGAVGERSSLPPMLAVLKGDGAARVRAKAARGLGRPEWADAVLVPLKGAACGDRDPAVRAAALTALGTIASAPAAEAIRCGLRDADPEVRAAAGRALESLGRPERR
jgi:HEAT repeat protein